jgi:tyramine---L-glutamate ligase
MKLLVYEYCCATGLGRSTDHPAHSLFREGQAMRNALAADYQKLPDIEVHLLDGDDAQSEPQQFRRSLESVDAVLVIAPEFDSLLADRCEWAKQAGKITLNCTSEAIQLCGDKWQLAQLWRTHQINTPRTRLAGRTPEVFPCIWKPRYGAGSTATQLIRTSQAAADYLAQYVNEPLAQERVEQEYVPGLATSVSVLCGTARAVPLLPSRQLINPAEGFHYAGGELPLTKELAERAIRLAEAALAPITGLRGYVGVDLILGNSPSGDADFVIEINPRLTTSYLGLRELCHNNLAEQIFKICLSAEPLSLTWKPESLRFSCSGDISHRQNNL